jgi:hypothetical protein
VDVAWLLSDFWSNQRNTRLELAWETLNVPSSCQQNLHIAFNPCQGALRATNGFLNVQSRSGFSALSTFFSVPTRPVNNSDDKEEVVKQIAKPRRRKGKRVWASPRPASSSKPIDCLCGKVVRQSSSLSRFAFWEIFFEFIIQIYLDFLWWWYGIVVTRILCFARELWSRLFAATRKSPFKRCVTLRSPSAADFTTHRGSEEGESEFLGWSRRPNPSAEVAIKAWKNAITLQSTIDALMSLLCLQSRSHATLVNLEMQKKTLLLLGLTRKRFKCHSQFKDSRKTFYSSAR